MGNNQSSFEVNYRGDFPANTVFLEIKRWVKLELSTVLNV
jgi:hypothetical protein